MPDAPPGRVAALYRYPVKSLSGESPERLEVDRRGVVGDRLWSVRDPDGRFGSGKTTRRFRRMPGLLDLVAAYDGEVPLVHLPDGTVVRGDDPAVHDVLSRHVGRPVTLAREEAETHFDEGPVHLVGTGSLDRVARAHGSPVDPRHLRPNVVVATEAAEDDWAGRALRVGSVVVRVSYAMPRCVMLDLPQDGVPGAHGLLRTVTRVAGGELGVVADVLEPGVVTVGDEVVVL